jgi:hypothetical protein
MLSNNPQIIQGIANSAISRFEPLMRSPLKDDKVDSCTANARAIGLSPSYAVAALYPLPIIVGGVGQVLCGATSVTQGDRCKADGSHGVIPIAVGGGLTQNVIGIAQRSAVQGDIFPLQVEIYDTLPGDYLS